MSTLKTFILLALLTLDQIHADTIGGEASAGFFNHDPSGDAAYIGRSENLNDTFGFNEEQDLFLKIYLEHPLPLIPNIKLGYTTLSHHGSSDVSNFTWGDIENYDGTIQNTFSLDMTDITLYYELLDNWAEVDAGFTLRYLSGDLGVSSTVGGDVAAFTTWVPLLYGKARFNMPITDLSFQIEANAISYWDITAYDYELSARYTVLMGLGIEAGFKAHHLNSDDLLNGFKTEVDFAGPYAAVIWDF